MAEGKTQRLFFALWPDEALQQHFYRLARELHKQSRGKPIIQENIHLTLAFMGPVEADTQACLEGMASDIAAPEFELSLDLIGYWGRPRIVWAGCSETPGTLTELVGQLQSGLAECGLQADTRPYAPHLSLIRKANKRPEVGLEPVIWPLQDFVLVSSKTLPTGAEYRVIRRWPLLGEKKENI